VTDLLGLEHPQRQAIPHPASDMEQNVKG
jgi:hypothetical protein